MKILAILALLGSLNALAANRKCTDVLVERQPTAIENFTAYFTLLMEEGVLGELHLELLAKQGDLNAFLNEQSRISSTVAVHREVLVEFIEAIDRKELQQWALEKLTRRNAVRKKRGIVRTNTEVPFQLMQFHRVEGGTFLMGEAGSQVEVTLTHPIEVMSTPVTQKMWFDLTGVNPAFFKIGVHSFLGIKNYRHVPMQADLPVEQVTWWSALRFANLVSTNARLKPTYLFDRETLANPNYIKGASAGIFINNFKAPKINAPGGNIYEAEGYRLPTEAEQEYLLQLASASIGAGELKSYAWFEENSSMTTQPVGTHKPIVINGNNFYDLFGNVREWGNDVLGKLKGGINPVNLRGHTKERSRVMRGGDYRTHDIYLLSDHRYGETPSTRSISTGFRLVRTLK